MATIDKMTQTYFYYTANPTRDSYGQLVWPTQATGVIDMAIYLNNQTVNSNIKYADCDYIGLTHDAVDDKYIIQYGQEKLKVMYINTFGRYTQVFMQRV